MSESFGPGGRRSATDQAADEPPFETYGAADAVSVDTGALVPVLDYDTLGVRTVLVRLRAREGCVSAVASDVRGPEQPVVYETTGEFNVFIVGRFRDLGRLDAFLSRLATDDRILTVTATVARRTICEDGRRPPVRE